ncbi:MAG: hypothetical protein ACK40M_10635 [Flavobacteriales bacterium]
MNFIRIKYLWKSGIGVFIFIPFFLLCNSVSAQIAINSVSNNSEVTSLINKCYKKKIKNKILRDGKPILIVDTTQKISAYHFISGTEFFPVGFPDSIKKAWLEREQVKNYSSYSDTCPGLFCFFSDEAEGYQIAEIFLVTNKSKYYRGNKCSFISGSTRIQILIHRGKIIKVISLKKPNKCYLY